MRALRLTSGRRYPGAITCAAALSLLALSFGTRTVSAESGPKERAISSDEVVSWLDSNGDHAPLVDSGAGEEELAPPPPPRHRGFVVESGIGAFGQLGEMRHISPVAPWFHVQLGYEPLRFLMVFAEGDLMISDTGYAHQPPPERTYSLWGFGAGLRGTVKVSDRVGLYLQASAGAAEVTADVLRSYGYTSADQLNLYIAGELGVEWYQVSPHLALAVHGGVRDYTATFKREQSAEPPLAWVSGLALRYTF